MPENTFGDRVTIARGVRLISQTELAKRCETTPSRICNLEAGRNNPSIQMAIKVADALDVSLDFLTGRTDGDPAMQRKIEILAQIEALRAQL